MLGHLGLIVTTLAVGREGIASRLPAQSLQGVQLCQTCHQEIVASFLETAHYRTSANATPQSVRGAFSAGHNVLHTRSPGVYFRMERSGGGFQQTGVDSARGWSRTERIDLVIGSGRRGQSFLHWKRGLLFELPVSSLTGPDRWINSPGYVDGEIDFDRIIVPHCLECHTTSFPLRRAGRGMLYGRDYVLGITCEKCHGDGRAHARYHAAHPGDSTGHYILNPARFSRDRKVDGCALCHSGERDPKAPPFSYRPGEKLDDYFLPAASRSAVPDVHGNQVGLLRRSKCFRSSPDFSCSTCHDVHRPQRDVAAFAQKCLACHQPGDHPRASEIGSERLLADCIDCHMPNRRSQAIQINTPTRPFALYYRSHQIAIYPEAARGP
jgi:hypothetical protein